MSGFLLKKTYLTTLKLPYHSVTGSIIKNEKNESLPIFNNSMCSYTVCCNYTVTFNKSQQYYNIEFKFNLLRFRGLMTLWTALQKEYLFKNNFLSNVYETRYTIHEIMNSWLEEKHHPEMLFFRNYTDNSVQYRSQNYYYYKCKIPINYATSRNINYYKTSNIIWYEGNQTKYIAGLNSHQYFIANLEQVGKQNLINL